MEPWIFIMTDGHWLNGHWPCSELILHLILWGFFTLIIPWNLLSSIDKNVLKTVWITLKRNQNKYSMRQTTTKSLKYVKSAPWQVENQLLWAVYQYLTLHRVAVLVKRKTHIKSSPDGKTNPKYSHHQNRHLHILIISIALTEKTILCFLIISGPVIIACRIPAPSWFDDDDDHHNDDNAEDALYDVDDKRKEGSGLSCLCDESYHVDSMLLPTKKETNVDSITSSTMRT